MNKTQEKNLQALKNFLSAEKVQFSENLTVEGVHCDLYIGRFHIAVHVSDDKDQEFFHATKCRQRPFFIRDTETEGFTVEKAKNCIIKAMKRRHEKLEKRKERKK